MNISEKIFFFLVFFMIARQYPPAVYGEIITLFSLSTVFIIIFGFGLPVFMQRMMAIPGSDRSEIFSRVMMINFLTFIAYFLSLFVYYKLVYNEIPFKIFIPIALVMYESSLINLANKALAGVNELKKQFYSLGISRIITLVLFAAALFYFHYSLDILFFILAGGFLLNLFILFRYLGNLGIKLNFSAYNSKVIKAILKTSLPLGLAIIFNFLYNKIDILLLSVMTDYSKVAFYNIGYGIFQASSLSFSFLLVGGFSRISSLSRSKTAILLLFRKYSRIISLICITVSIPLFFFAAPVVKLLYTERYFESASVLKILAFAIIAVGLNNLAGVILTGIGMFKVGMYIALAAFIINVTLNLIVIPVYGITGAGIITVITEYFILAADLYYLFKILKPVKTAYADV